MDLQMMIVFLAKINYFYKMENVKLAVIHVQIVQLATILMVLSVLFVLKIAKRVLIIFAKHALLDILYKEEYAKNRFLNV